MTRESWTFVCWSARSSAFGVARIEFWVPAHRCHPNESTDRLRRTRRIAKMNPNMQKDLELLSQLFANPLSNEQIQKLTEKLSPLLSNPPQSIPNPTDWQSQQLPGQINQPPNPRRSLNLDFINSLFAIVRPNQHPLQQQIPDQAHSLVAVQQDQPPSDSIFWHMAKLTYQQLLALNDDQVLDPYHFKTLFAALAYEHNQQLISGQPVADQLSEPLVSESPVDINVWLTQTRHIINSLPAADQRNRVATQLRPKLQTLIEDLINQFKLASALHSTKAKGSEAVLVHLNSINSIPSGEYPSFSNRWKSTEVVKNNAIHICIKPPSLSLLNLKRIKIGHRFGCDCLHSQLNLLAQTKVLELHIDLLEMPEGLNREYKFDHLRTLSIDSLIASDGQTFAQSMPVTVTFDAPKLNALFLGELHKSSDTSRLSL